MPVKQWREGISEGGSSQCKGPEEEQTYVRSSREAGVAGLQLREAVAGEAGRKAVWG